MALHFLGRGVPAVARTQLLKNKAWIAGQWRDAISGKMYPVYNPSNQQLIAEVPDMGEEDVVMAVREAYSAQKGWAGLTAKERSGVLRRWFNLITQNTDDLAKIVSLECGKPLAEATLEIKYGASFVEWFAEEAKRVYGDIVPTSAKDRRLLVIKQPVGVAALITPWNFPSAMVTRKAAPALAAGCTTVIKPSEETPFSTLALAELAQQAGVPPGVLNVVTCSRQSVAKVGESLSKSQLVSKLSFTGSTHVGKILMAQGADSMKRLSLELGGNAPFIVFNSADIPLAAKHAVFTKYRNAGQTCICTNRLLVQSGVHDQFVEEMVKAVGALKQGDPFTEGVNLGPLINEPAAKKVEQHVADAVKKGGHLIVGGKRNSTLGGTFFEPSIVTGITTEMMMSQQEIFGPVAGIIKFQEEEEAIALANSTRYGLASYVFSRDIGQVWRTSEGLEFGMVGVNEGGISTEMTPFGGVKESGFGREGSRYGMDEYQYIKYICMGNIK
eukprot:Em0001g3822a